MKKKNVNSKAQPMTEEKTDFPARKERRAERPIPAGIYPVIDTDLGRDNVENDLPAADLTELS